MSNVLASLSSSQNECENSEIIITEQQLNGNLATEIDGKDSIISSSETSSSVERGNIFSTKINQVGIADSND